jgi:hypothetical protein
MATFFGIDDEDIDEFARLENEKRLTNRARYSHLTQEDLDKENDTAWHNKTLAIEAIVAIAEELLVRTISNKYPHANKIILVEDKTHDSPHGHVGEIRDSQDLLIIDGRSEEWHDLDWTSDIDDLVWQLYTYGKNFFVGTPRVMVIDI